MDLRPKAADGDGLDLVLPRLHYSPQDPHPSRLGPLFSGGGLYWSSEAANAAGEPSVGGTRVQRREASGEPQGQRVGGGRKAFDAGQIMDVRFLTTRGQAPGGQASGPRRQRGGGGQVGAGEEGWGLAALWRVRLGGQA